MNKNEAQHLKINDQIQRCPGAIDPETTDAGHVAAKTATNFVVIWSERELGPSLFWMAEPIRLASLTLYQPPD